MERNSRCATIITTASGSTTIRISPATSPGSSARCALAVARLPAWDGTTQQLLALVVAFLVTGLTFNATA